MHVIIMHSDKVPHQYEPDCVYTQYPIDTCVNALIARIIYDNDIF